MTDKEERELKRLTLNLQDKMDFLYEKLGIDPSNDISVLLDELIKRGIVTSKEVNQWEKID